MPVSGSHADNITMKGGGYYSLATKGAKDVIDGATPLVSQALNQMTLDGTARPFAATDMGCADGGTSIQMIGDILAQVRKAAPQRPLAMYYTDQPGNDYNALFQVLNGGTAIKSYLQDLDNLFVYASATSFYKQILPPESLDLGFSATAMHWLSCKPCNITTHIQAVGAEGSELRAFSEQGRRDWETILLNRAKELVSGGHLVLVNFGVDEAGRYLGNTGGQHMFNIMNGIWQSFVDDGTITQAEYDAMTLPQYYKTVDEFTEPLANKRSPVHQAGLRLDHIETRVVRCPFAEDYKVHGDAAVFAETYIPTIRSWNESIFFGALSSDRPLEERREIIERYYGTYQDMVERDPEGHGMDYVHAYVIIRKE